MWFSNFIAMPAIGTVFVRRSGLKQNSPKGDFNWAWERRSVHTWGHCRWPLHDILWWQHTLIWTLYLLKDFRNKKNSTIFKSRLYSNFSNPTVMNKSKQETESVNLFSRTPPLIPPLPKYGVTVQTYCYYSWTPLFRSPKGNGKKFEIAGFRNNRGGVTFVTMNWSFVVIWYCV